MFRDINVFPAVQQNSINSVIASNHLSAHIGCFAAILPDLNPGPVSAVSILNAHFLFLLPAPSWQANTTWS